MGNKINDKYRINENLFEYNYKLFAYLTPDEASNAKYR